MPHTRPMALSSPPIDSLIEAIASPHPHGDRKLVYAAFESLPPELVRSLAARAIGQPPRDGYLFARVVKGVFRVAKGVPFPPASATAAHTCPFPRVVNGVPLPPLSATAAHI